MARYFDEDPEYTQISVEDLAKRDKIVAIINAYTKEMEGYSYYGSNPGVEVDDYADIADDIMKEFNI
jgi:hypothetical protein